MIFGSFHLDLASYSLTRRVAGEADVRIKLRPKAFNVLQYLVTHTGRIVSHDELLSEIWGDTFVQPEVLKGHVLAVRRALGDRVSGDRASAQHYIETVRGRGYRFVADLRSGMSGAFANAQSGADETLAGRDGARAELAAALSRACAGEAQVMIVSGEPGIGKTALADTFAAAASAQGVTVVTVRCLPGSGQADAYYPILEMLVSLGRNRPRANLRATLAQCAPTWLIQVPALYQKDMPALRDDLVDATPHRMGREFRELVYALTQTEAMLIVLDDIHWADRATLDLLEALATQRMQTKLMILATLRDSGPNARNSVAATLTQKLSLYRLASEVRLQRLAFAEVEQFLCAQAGAVPPLPLTTHLHTRSEGNPLFMRAMLEMLVQRNLVRRESGGWQMAPGFDPQALRAPPSLVQIITSEINDLPPEEQAVLGAASVSDGHFSATVHHAATAMSEDRFEAVCEAMHRRGQLIRRSTVQTLTGGKSVQVYDFRHALFWEIANDREGPVRRARAHAAIARRLIDLYAADCTPVASHLARHCLEGGLLSEAIGYHRMAARTAMQRFAQREAATLLEQAIELNHRLPVDQRAQTELGLLEDLARIYLGVFDPRTLEIYEQLARLAGERGNAAVEARALSGLGYAISWHDADQAIAIMQQVLNKSADIADPVQRARVRCKAHGWRSWVQGWSAIDAAGLDAAIDELRLLDDRVALNASLIEHSLILFPASRYREAIDVIEASYDVLLDCAPHHEIDFSLPLWVVRLGLPWAKMSAGRLGDALDGFAAGYAAFEANGDLGDGGVTMQLYRAFVFVMMHDFRAALTWLDETVAVLRKTGRDLTANETKTELTVRGLATLGLGDGAAATAHFAGARSATKAQMTLTSWYWDLAGDWGMTDVCLRAGDLAAAEHCCTNFEKRAGATEERGWRALAAEAMARIALAQGDCAAASAHLDRAWAQISGYDTPLVRWRLHAVGAVVAERLAAPEEAARLRRSQALELALLADSLPVDHPGRAALGAAQPFVVEVDLTR